MRIKPNSGEILCSTTTPGLPRPILRIVTYSFLGQNNTHELNEERFILIHNFQRFKLWLGGSMVKQQGRNSPGHDRKEAECHQAGVTHIPLTTVLHLLPPGSTSQHQTHYKPISELIQCHTPMIQHYTLMIHSLPKASPMSA